MNGAAAQEGVLIAHALDQPQVQKPRVKGNRPVEIADF
jgi:hypothetical protein